MREEYKALYHAIFKDHDYTWEDIDRKMYRKILLEEGYDKEAIKKEMTYLKKKSGEISFFGIVSLGWNFLIAEARCILCIIPCR